MKRREPPNYAPPPSPTAQVADTPLFGGEPEVFTTPTLARRLAREKAAHASAHHRDALLAVLRLHGPQTADDAGALAGLAPLSARPRMTELSNLGAITCTGERRPSSNGNPSTVWRVVGL